ncbi:MAG: ABC transporter ATPase [Bacteroidia bacterium]
MTLFSEMPAHSRVWIYQASRELSAQEIADARAKANAFLADWTSHGSLMRASADVLHNRFLVIAVDEQAATASGCGIDKSVRFVQQLEKELNVPLFDRMQVAYRDVSGEVKAVKMQEFEQLAAEGKVTGDTLVFNNLVATLSEMQQGWEVKANKSWHARLIPA